MEKSKGDAGADNVERFISSLTPSLHFDMTMTWHSLGDDGKYGEGADPVLLNEHLDAFIRNHTEHVDRIISYCGDHHIGEFEEDLVPLMGYLELHPSLSGGNL